MKLILKSTKLNKKLIVGVIVLSQLFISRNAIALSGNREKKDVLEYKDRRGRRTIVVGVPESEKEPLLKGLEESDKKFQLLDEADAYFKQGRYQEALNSLNHAMKYANPDNLSSWNIHWELADVYEAMVEKDEFLKEIDWMISRSKNEKTTREFQERKERFLNNLPTVSDRNEKYSPEKAFEETTVDQRRSFVQSELRGKKSSEKMSQALILESKGQFKESQAIFLELLENKNSLIQEQGLEGELAVYAGIQRTSEKLQDLENEKMALLWLKTNLLVADGTFYQYRNYFTKNNLENLETRSESLINHT